MKAQFCKEVLEFLKSEYSDAYEFNINLYEDQFRWQAELKIKSGNFTRIISNCYMKYFYNLYLQDTSIIQERNQFKWQKELIDLIEGS